MCRVDDRGPALKGCGLVCRVGGECCLEGGSARFPRPRIQDSVKKPGRKWRDKWVVKHPAF